MSPSTESIDTLFPEPDSPTMPEHLAGLEVVAHVRDRTDDAVLGAELDRQVTDLEDRLGHGLCAGSTLRRVERVPQAVADEVDAESDDDDREPRECHEPPELEAFALAVDDQLAECGVRRLDAEPEEGEGRLVEDGSRDDQRREDDDRPDAVREDVPQDDAMSLAPAAFAASTNSFSRSDRKRPRTTRASPTQKSSARMIPIFIGCGIVTGIGRG